MPSLKSLTPRRKKFYPLPFPDTWAKGGLGVLKEQPCCQVLPWTQLYYRARRKTKLKFLLKQVKNETCRVWSVQKLVFNERHRVNPGVTLPLKYAGLAENTWCCLKCTICYLLTTIPINLSFVKASPILWFNNLESVGMKNPVCLQPTVALPTVVVAWLTGNHARQAQYWMNSSSVMLRK